MSSKRYEIIDGPDKPALQWSLTKPSGEHDVQFRVEGDAFNARIQRMDEQQDGFSFMLQGRLTSGRAQGTAFRALYSIESRSGWLELVQ